MKRFAGTAKALLLTEFVSAFWLAMKYFVRPKALSCALTMSFRLSEPAQSSTVMMTKPIETS